MTKHQDKQQKRAVPQSGKKGGQDGGGDFKNDTERQTADLRVKNSEHNLAGRKS